MSRALLAIGAAACGGGAATKPLVANELGRDAIEVREAREGERGSCEISGTPQPDLVAPIIAFIRRGKEDQKLLHTDVRRDIPHQLEDVSPGEGEYALVIDPRSEVGELVVSYSKFLFHYCLFVEQRGAARTVIVKSWFTYVRPSSF